MEKDEKLKYLTWFDVIILSILLFGNGIYASSIYFLEIWKSGKNVAVADISIADFSSVDNWYSFVIQVMFLMISIGYLMYRKFDFSQWKFSFSIKNILAGFLLFLFTAAMMDLYFSMLYGFQQMLSSERLSLLGNIQFSTIVYAMLNGSYEELFFLGICFSTKENKKWRILLFSLIVRFSFHTYQGLEPAIGIGFLMGILYFFLYSHMKEKNLLPYFIAHAIADVFGLSILQFI